MLWPYCCIVLGRSRKKNVSRRLVLETRNRISMKAEASAVYLPESPERLEDINPQATHGLPCSVLGLLASLVALLVTRLQRV